MRKKEYADGTADSDNQAAKPSNANRAPPRQVPSQQQVAWKQMPPRAPSKVAVQQPKT